MATPFLAQIMITSFGFAPKGWAQCNGQLMAINQNQALFALLGTTYGGNGQSTFALPNLQSRVPIHFGSGSGLSNYPLGFITGEESHTLTLSESGHNHPVSVFNGNGNVKSPVGNVHAIVQGTATNIYSTAPATTATSEGWNNAGGNNSNGTDPHNNIEPYLTLNFCIALQGIFPSQN
jgi:microcystin-dependent protein